MSNFNADDVVLRLADRFQRMIISALKDERSQLAKAFTPIEKRYSPSIDFGRKISKASAEVYKTEAVVKVMIPNAMAGILEFIDDVIIELRYGVDGRGLRFDIIRKVGSQLMGYSTQQLSESLNFTQLEDIQTMLCAALMMTDIELQIKDPKEALNAFSGVFKVHEFGQFVQRHFSDVRRNLS